MEWRGPAEHRPQPIMSICLGRRESQINRLEEDIRHVSGLVRTAALMAGRPSPQLLRDGDGALPAALGLPGNSQDGADGKDGRGHAVKERDASALRSVPKAVKEPLKTPQTTAQRGHVRDGGLGESGGRQRSNEQPVQQQASTRGDSVEV